MLAMDRGGGGVKEEKSYKLVVYSAFERKFEPAENEPESNNACVIARPTG